MSDQLRGRTALVTGASRGIGRAIAVGLAAQGAHVVVNYLKNDVLAAKVVETITRAGGTAVVVQADLSGELGARNITVNAISPGPTDTDMMQDQYRDTIAMMSPFHRIGQTDDVADVAVFLASPAARWVTGQNIAAGGGVF